MSRLSKKLAKAIRWEAEGLRLAGSPLWLDSTKKRSFGFISHAHSDHVANHDRVLAAPETLRLLGLSEQTGAMPAQYQRPFNVGPHRLELLPSGHLPGGAQLLIEIDGIRVLYSSDVYDDRQRFSKPLVMTTCDLLIIEATYGTPRHRFPPRTEAANLLREEVQAVLDDSGLPLVLVEGSLGRAQEVLAELAVDGHKLLASKSVFRWNQKYRDLELDVARCQMYAGRPELGSVLVYPMRSRGLKGFASLKGLVKIACSGQRSDSKDCKRLGVDRIIPFVDHSDFDGLIRIVEACRPKKVLTIYGHADVLAGELRERGFDADSIEQTKQLALDI